MGWWMDGAAFVNTAARVVVVVTLTIVEAAVAAVAAKL